MWVSTGEALKLVDQHARAYERTVQLGRPAGGLTAAGGALWVASSTDGVIFRVDPRRETVRTFDLGRERQHLRIVAGADGALWAADDKALIELDPSTGSARRELSPPGPFRTAALADGVLWLYGEDGVWALDAASGDLLGRVELPGRNLGQIAAAGSVAWITDYVNSRVRRVELSREGPDREPTAARRAERLCAEPGSIAGDFDGDHRPDRAYHTWVASEGGARLGVCTAADVDEIDGAGQAEGTLRAVDLNGDSRDELVFGATTASQSLAAVAVLRDGRLQVVTTGDGLELILADGPRDETTADAWGCDRADDGAREIVQATVRHEGPTAHWQRQAFRLHATTAARAGTTQGTMPAAREPQAQAGELVHGC